MASRKKTIDAYFRPLGAMAKTTASRMASISTSTSTSTGPYQQSKMPSEHLHKPRPQQGQGQRNGVHDQQPHCHGSIHPSRPPASTATHGTTTAVANDMFSDEDDTDMSQSASSSQDSHDRQDPYDLYRFLSAQDHLDPRTSSPWLGTYAAALGQLRRGRKTSHWVWYVFPQMPLARPGLGRVSETSRIYGISSLAEAVAYLAHDVLGPRLHEITRVVLESPVEDVEELMGSETDRDKLLSCMTLFARAAAASASAPAPRGAEEGTLFADVLDKYFDGERDAVTERALDEEEEQSGEEGI